MAMRKKGRAKRKGLWAALGVAAAIAALGALVWAEGVLFRRRVASETTEMWAAAAEPRPIDRARLGALPIPVRRYLERAIGARQRPVRTVRLGHGGTFRTKLDGAWAPIRGEQYFAADPPGFVWWGRVRMAPGLWIEARDRSVGGVGSMLVKAASTVTLADARGPELDQGALLRLLGEMLWFPTALLDARYVTWTALDDRRALAALRVGGREAAAVFEFGEDGLPAAFQAERYRDLGNGRSVLTPFRGESADYREVDGMLVPHRMTAAWEVDGRPIPYARFLVERLEYDAVAPF
jgi:hypothetical protein